MTDNTDQMLKDQVETIAQRLTDGIVDPDWSPEDNDNQYDGNEPTAFDWLEGVLDIEYIVSGKKEYLGARVLVAFGGPNIWVDTRRGVVEGFWWGSYARAEFRDGIGLDEALQTLWEC